MMVDEDCSLHMLVTAPLSKFIDSSVKEYTSIATGKSAYKIYEGLNNKEIQRIKYVAYGDGCVDGRGVPWLLMVRGASQIRFCGSGQGYTARA
jgi:hypothetical protein